MHERRIVLEMVAVTNCHNYLLIGLSAFRIYPFERSSAPLHSLIFEVKACYDATLSSHRSYSIIKMTGRNTIMEFGFKALLLKVANERKEESVPLTPKNKVQTTIAFRTGRIDWKFTHLACLSRSRPTPAEAAPLPRTNDATYSCWGIPL